MKLEYVLGIDFKQLKAQKAELLQQIGRCERTGYTEAAEKLEGILNMIDSIQDQAVSVHNIFEADVFNYEDSEQD